MKLKIIFILLFLGSYFLGISQEVTPPSHIKSIQFKGENPEHQFPIVQLGETFELSFDDLNPNPTDYYYQFTHCNTDWSVSDLLKSEYLEGLDDLRISNYTHSFGTLQPYTNYQISFPNSDTRLRLSGNYLLTITDENQQVIFTKRLVVYTPLVSISAEINPPQSVQYITQKQNVNFKISPKNFFLENPQESVQVVILQNYNWQTLRTGFPPQYLAGNQLIYRYDEPTSFWGGNEYFYFENRDIHTATHSVYATKRQGDEFHSYLLTNPNRKNMPYTYQPDINGGFRIRTSQGQPHEAEYVWVHFSVDAFDCLPTDEVFVYGEFSENKLTDDFRLTYNEKTHRFEGKVLLKQGFYNYKFARKHPNNTDYNAFSGNFFATENNYTILVYYRPQGSLYDQIIGVVTK